MTEAEILEKLKEAITTYDDNLAEEMAKEAIKIGMDPLKAVDEGMVKGLDVVGELYENEEIFLPELMMAARAFQAGMSILEPKILERATFIRLERILLPFFLERPALKFMI